MQVKSLYAGFVNVVWLLSQIGQHVVGEYRGESTHYACHPLLSDGKWTYIKERLW